MCMSCQKARTMGSKMSTSRQTYSPKKSSTNSQNSSLNKRINATSYGSPKVRMSFGTRRKG